MSTGGVIPCAMGCNLSESSIEFNVIFYADDGSGQPPGAGMDDPTSTALAVYNFPAVTGTSYGTNKYEYDVTIPGSRRLTDAGSPSKKYLITR